MVGLCFSVFLQTFIEYRAQGLQACCLEQHSDLSMHEVYGIFSVCKP